MDGRGACGGLQWLDIHRSQCLRSTDGVPTRSEPTRGQAKVGYTRAACRAFHAAFQAWDWAHIHNAHDPEEILLATLLHDIAEMALWVAAPEKVHLMRKLIIKDHLHTDEAQYIALGDSLEHFSRQIAISWELPQLVHDALRPENSGNSRVQCVMLAVQLGREAEQGWRSDKMQRTLELISEFLGKSLDETTSHIHKNAVRAARETPFFNTRPAAALLPLLPGDDHILIEDEFPEDEAEIEASIRHSTFVSPDSAQASNSPTDGEQHHVEHLSSHLPASQICLTPQVDAFKQTINALKAGIGTMKVNDIMRCVVHGLHDGVGLNRVVFSLLSKDHSKLMSRYIIGADNDPVFSRFLIRMDKPNLFSKLLEKPVSLWINDENRPKYWKMVPEEFKTLIKTNTFLTTSVHVRGKPIGLFYADRRSGACELDDHAYTQFRQICQAASKCLAHISKNT